MDNDVRVLGTCEECRQHANLLAPNWDLCARCAGLTDLPKTPLIAQSLPQTTSMTDLDRLQETFDQIGIKYRISHHHPVEEIPDQECCSVIVLTSKTHNVMKTIFHFDKFGNYLRNGLLIND